MAQAQRLDTIANNIANVNTPGFKRDEQVFREYLSANENPPALQNVPKIPASIDSFYDFQGGDVSFVDSIGTYTDHTQGGLQSTGNPLDVALDGPGFFEVSTPQGVRMTRYGSFRVDAEGRLVTKEGYPVLLSGEPLQDPESRLIQSNGGILRITEQGEVFEDENLLGSLSVVKAADRDSLQKVGQSLFQLRGEPAGQLTSEGTKSLKSGFIESSNVNIVKEMTDMISATRSFESNQKAIQAYDQIADKLVNQVSKV
jgi:flagellar basal-body rod protein FlgG